MLTRAVEGLLDHDVHFAVVGGFAVVAHGSALMTFDLDRCMIRSVGALGLPTMHLRGDPNDVA